MLRDLQIPTGKGFARLAVFYAAVGALWALSARGVAGVLYARFGALAYGAMAAAARVGAGVCTLALALALGVTGFARTC